MKAVNSRRPFRSSTWNEYYTNGRQSRGSKRSAANAGSTRTNFCVFRGRCDHQRTLVIRVAAITLASDSAITLARFRLSKGTNLRGRIPICGFLPFSAVSCENLRFPNTVDMEIKVKLIPRKYFIAFAFAFDINSTDGLLHSCPHRHITRISLSLSLS